MSYKYTKEQHNAINTVMLKAYKEIHATGLFPNGVPPMAHTASWAMMAMLKPGAKPNNTADGRALRIIDFKWKDKA